jgi:NAD(P)-dependent dehydrogenase (short-subunit alcohol dehydrogenase family)
MALPLAGRTALVTGGARRVGRAIALELGARGADVVVAYHRSAEQAAEVVHQLEGLGRRACAIAQDLALPAGPGHLVGAAIDALGGLDILVCSAGPFARVPFTGGDDAAWETAWADALALTVMAPARLARAAAGTLASGAARRGSPGVIVNILDIAAWQAWPGYAHHGAAKAALAHLTRTLAVALAPAIRCVGVAPGIVDWPEAMTEATRARLLARVPAGRAGHPADVARAVADLVLADYVTGSVLIVDGGRLAATGEGA